ncbi:MAG TPA: hypothetical protein VGE04_15450 [Chloroflexia bacterium]|jgi:hypothetical protein
MDWLKPNTLGKILVYGLLVLIVLAVIAGLVSANPGGKAGEMTATLALITSVAIGIERAQEVFWMAIDSKYGDWWPFTLVTRPIKDLQTRLTGELPAYLTNAGKLVTDLQNSGKLAQGELEKLNKNLEEAKEQLTKLRDSLPKGKDLESLLTALQANLKNVQAKIPEGQQGLEFGNAALDIVASVLDSAKDNPARRVIGMFIGSAAGIVIAAMFGLDLFWAVLGKETAFYFGSEPNLLTLHAGVSISGIIIGLGADPTHQVVRLLEERKKQAKKDNRTDESTSEAQAAWAAQAAQAAQAASGNP